MNVKDFMKPPSRRAWNQAFRDGWRGADGSSNSTDHIMGVRIGVTTTDWADRDFPATLHDYRYFLGRLHGLGRDHQRAADVAFREDCIQAIKAKLDGKTMIAIGVVRSWVRYAALRAFGFKAFGRKPFGA